ncbi:MAG: hypothetical protein J3K34DRAFT_442052 [Monoraphidium minutum]|nr:MAG: hypothetical protein J3K34DRAFT_442052 [Monoraphidium minutum]
MGSSGKKRKAEAAGAQEQDDARPSTSGGGGGAAAAADELSNVVYIGHLPHGFYEDQLLGFFSQFGHLTRVRVSRSKRTGRAKHYAFLEFGIPEVAAIAAGAMDGHFMFAQRLSVRCLKRGEVRPDLFKGANRKFKQVPWRKIEAERHNKERTPQEHARRVASLLRRDRKRRDRIAEAGIDYEYDGLAAALPGKAKKIKFTD